MLNPSQFRSSDHDPTQEVNSTQKYSIKQNTLNQIAEQNTNTPNTSQFRGFAAGRKMVDGCR